MKRFLITVVLLLALNAKAQVSYWFSEWQQSGTAQIAQQFFMVPGSGINFTYSTNHVIINAGPASTATNWLGSNSMWTALSLNPFSYLTANQPITVSKDATYSGGSGTAISLTVTNIEPPGSGSSGQFLELINSSPYVVGWGTPAGGGGGNSLTNFSSYPWTNSVGTLNLGGTGQLYFTAVNPAYYQIEWGNGGSSISSTLAFGPGTVNAQPSLYVSGIAGGYGLLDVTGTIQQHTSGGNGSNVFAGITFGNGGFVGNLIGNVTTATNWLGSNSMQAQITGIQNSEITTSNTVSTNVWFLNGNTLGNTNHIFGSLDQNPVKMAMGGLILAELRTNDSISLGPSNITSGMGAISLGTNNSVTGLYGISIGNAYLGSGGNWFAGNTVSGQSSIAIGSDNTVSGIDAVAIGNACFASDGGALAFGYASQAVKSNAVAIGYKATCAGTNAFALGLTANANNDGSFVWRDGWSSTTANGPITDSSTNQFIATARGGAQFSMGGNGFIFEDKVGVSSAVYSKITNGVVYAQRGFFSLSKNLLSPVAISVGASPFSWTNYASTAGTNVFVFVDGTGCVGSIAINGTTVFQTLTNAAATIPLQPGEYVTATYSVGTPTLTWKPF